MLRIKNIIYKSYFFVGRFYITRPLLYMSKRGTEILRGDPPRSRHLLEELSLTPNLSLGPMLVSSLTWLAWGSRVSREAWLSFVTNGTNGAEPWRPRRADVTATARESSSPGGATFSFQSY